MFEKMMFESFWKTNKKYGLKNGQQFDLMLYSQIKVNRIIKKCIQTKNFFDGKQEK